MGSIWQSDRFKLGVINVVVLAACEAYYQATGNRVSVEFQTFLTATLLGMIGMDTVRKMRKPENPNNG